MEANKKIIKQTLKKTCADSLELGQKYYSLLSSVNHLNLTERELQLLAFAAIKGNISYANIRQEFCDTYKTSNATINNMISKLRKMGVLIKEASKVKVNPVIALDFSKPITLEINLIHG